MILYGRQQFFLLWHTRDKQVLYNNFMNYIIGHNKLIMQDKIALFLCCYLSYNEHNAKFFCRYTVHVLIGELHYACLTSRSNCPSSAIQLESCSQIFLQRLRNVYRELPILADLSRDLTNLAVADLSKPLKKIIVSDKIIL